jgi:glutamine synthetase
VNVSPSPLGASELDALSSELSRGGSTLLLGTLVDYAGVTRTKGVPIGRLRSYHQTGMGASPSWVVFCVDNGIAFTDTIGVAGDLRLRLDASKTRVIGEGIAWGPTDLCNQDGSASALCPRAALRAIVDQAAQLGLTAIMGTELEFTVTSAHGGEAASGSWASYGMRSVVERRGFLVDLTATLVAAGLAPEQIHAEYGSDQFEVSLPPAGPIDMADAGVLARIIVGLVAARHDLAVSFSPLPRVGGSGNGAHLHLSLEREGANVFSAGTGPHGMTQEGESAIAGILENLPELLGVFAGSAISGERLRPGSWSGASACWGLENREAAVRFLAGTAGNPHGANVELKVVDPSANLYLAAAALLGTALHGIASGTPLPEEVADDPAASGVVAPALPHEQSTIIDALERSERAEAILGEAILAGLVAVRRHEQRVFAEHTPDALADALRFAWS